MLNCTSPVTALAVLVSAIAPAVVATFSPTLCSAPLCPTAPPADSVSLPPILEDASVTPVESVIDASLPVERASVAKLLPLLVSTMAPPFAVALNDAAEIAPDCVMPPPETSASSPPTDMEPRPTEIVSVKLAAPGELNATVPDTAFAALVSTISPDVVVADRPALCNAPLCPTAPPADSVSLPPTVEAANVTPVESATDASPVVASVSVAKEFPALDKRTVPPLAVRLAA